MNSLLGAANPCSVSQIMKSPYSIKQSFNSLEVCNCFNEAYRNLDVEEPRNVWSFVPHKRVRDEPRGLCVKMKTFFMVR